MKNLTWIMILITILSISSTVYLYLNPKTPKVDYKIFQDSIATLQHDNGQLSYKYEAAILSNVKYLKEVATKDKHIKLLVANIKQLEDKNVNINRLVSYQSNLIVAYKDSLHNQIVGYDTVGEIVTPIVRKMWLVKADSNRYPFHNWIEQDITLGLDTFSTKLVVRDYPIITIGTESNGWFKKPTTFGYVTPSNPYVEVTSMKVVVEDDKPSPARKTLTFGIPVVLSFILGLLL